MGRNGLQGRVERGNGIGKDPVDEIIELVGIGHVSDRFRVFIADELGQAFRAVIEAFTLLFLVVAGVAAATWAASALRSLPTLGRALFALFPRNRGREAPAARPVAIIGATRPV